MRLGRVLLGNPGRALHSHAPLPRHGVLECPSFPGKLDRLTRRFVGFACRRSGTVLHASWFRGAEARHEGHIQAGGVDKDVALVETDNVNDEVDAEYRTNGHLAGLLSITDLARALAVGPRSGRTKVPS